MHRINLSFICRNFHLAVGVSKLVFVSRNGIFIKIAHPIDISIAKMIFAFDIKTDQRIGNETAKHLSIERIIVKYTETVKIKK